MDLVQAYLKKRKGTGKEGKEEEEERGGGGGEGTLGEKLGEHLGKGWQCPWELWPGCQAMLSHRLMLGTLNTP